MSGPNLRVTSRKTQPERTLSMSRVYAVREDTGKRFLLHLECDGCDATIKPHPEISESGWMKTGAVDGCGTKLWESDWCPRCYDIKGRFSV